MPKKQSKYIVRFQFKKGVDEAICRNSKFAKKKIEQLGSLNPRKKITVIISGTEVKKAKKFAFNGADWEDFIDKV